MAGTVALAAAAVPALDMTAAAAPQATAAGPVGTASLPVKTSDRLTIKSTLGVDLDRDFARLPLHRATVNGTSVWYVVTDVSDAGLATSLGLNFAPRLKNLITPECPECVQTVTSDATLGDEVVEFQGRPDFSPARMLVPGPDGGFPPAFAQPGSVAMKGYSPYVRIAGTDIVYDAPIVAAGDGPFDVVTHSDTHDRLLGIDTTAMTADVSFVRAFSNGEDIFYLSFDSSAWAPATIERSTFTPGIGLSPAPDLNRDPATASAAIFALANGRTGIGSPPAQGLDHVIKDGLNAKDLHARSTDVMAALRAGGDAHNVLDVFPTLADPALRSLYTPDWDVHIGVWSPAAVAQGLNTARSDANVIRQLATQGLVTSPGGTTLRSDRAVVNCPALGWEDTPPTAPQAPKPPEIP
ncbi:DUF7482 domain-containing protein [Motilibacter deserti]|uniref:DUF7482 domain-containing protein n=1 Tax=Motilibacter deserti TaxID=2714956 RepID=A0ABX0H0V9_9ACTN|nr:hypothetical protein [Motilibacter deserti]NHC16478.1 hypothetical protein [Motilibacter deserti]